MVCSGSFLRLCFPVPNFHKTIREATKLENVHTDSLRFKNSRRIICSFPNGNTSKFNI